jgi:hypothetical protein
MPFTVMKSSSRGKGGTSWKTFGSGSPNTALGLDTAAAAAAEHETVAGRVVVGACCLFARSRGLPQPALIHSLAHSMRCFCLLKCRATETLAHTASVPNVYRCAHLCEFTCSHRCSPSGVCGGKFDRAA